MLNAVYSPPPPTRPRFMQRPERGRMYANQLFSIMTLGYIMQLIVYRGLKAAP